jgi:hypothetical protein
MSLPCYDLWIDEPPSSSVNIHKDMPAFATLDDICFRRPAAYHLISPSETAIFWFHTRWRFWLDSALIMGLATWKQIDHMEVDRPR